MKHEVETAFGPVWLWGEVTGRPTLLMITGAFAEAGLLEALPEHLPEMDVLRAHLPGNHCPETVAHSIGVYSAAYGEALERLVPQAELTVFGLSTGALVALGLRRPNIRQFILLEPPLRTGGLWPLAQRFANPAPGYAAEFVWQVFGMGRGPTEPRDYTALLDGLRTPTIVICGDMPLNPERELSTIPSLLDEPERELLRRHPSVLTVVAQGAGHNVPAQNQAALLYALKAGLPEAQHPLTAAELRARAG